jgi:hypothetical protein
MKEKIEKISDLLFFKNPIVTKAGLSFLLGVTPYQLSRVIADNNEKKFDYEKMYKTFLNYFNKYFSTYEEFCINIQRFTTIQRISSYCGYTPYTLQELIANGKVPEELKEVYNELKKIIS